MKAFIPIQGADMSSSIPSLESRIQGSCLLWSSLWALWPLKSLQPEILTEVKVPKLIVVHLGQTFPCRLESLSFFRHSPNLISFKWSTPGQISSWHLLSEICNKLILNSEDEAWRPSVISFAGCVYVSLRVLVTGAPLFRAVAPSYDTIFAFSLKPFITECPFQECGWYLSLGTMIFPARASCFQPEQTQSSCRSTGTHNVTLNSKQSDVPSLLFSSND